jgi:hypothetical protein
VSQIPKVDSHRYPGAFSFHVKTFSQMMSTEDRLSSFGDPRRLRVRIRYDRSKRLAGGVAFFIYI